MFEVRQVLVRMRLGDSDRALAKAGLIGRPKAKAFIHDWSSTPSHAAGSDCVAGHREAPQGSTDNPRRHRSTVHDYCHVGRHAVASREDGFGVFLASQRSVYAIRLMNLALPVCQRMSSTNIRKNWDLTPIFPSVMCRSCSVEPVAGNAPTAALIRQSTTALTVR